MKTFQQFKQDINEAVPLAIPAGIAFKTGLGSLLGSSAIKSVVAGALTGAGYLASKKINKDKGEEEIKQRKQAEDEEVGKALGMNPGDKLPPVSRVKQNIKRGIEQYKKGLRAGLDVEKTSSTGPIGSASDEFREKEGGKSPAQIVRELIKKQKSAYKEKQIKNKRINKDLDIK